MKTIIFQPIQFVNENLRNPINHAPLQSRLPLILLVMACFALSPRVRAACDSPDPGCPGANLAEGFPALQSLTTGVYNTGIGTYSLLSLTDGSLNTGLGAGTLFASTGNQNTAIGAGALFSNSSGEDNNAVGAFALFSNTTAFFNNAHGREALFSNVDGTENNAFGDLAMQNNTTGVSNTAIGDDALRSNVDGSGNVAVGDEAGTGLGPSVNNCIAIGAPGAGPFATFDNPCFIGSVFGEPVSDPGTQTAVFVDQFNVVGIFNSSRRYKHDIQPMDKTSETLYELKPVTFKFNSDWKGTTQYGLIAEEVAEVDPRLVVRRNGETITVRYEQINAMLLNEFLKEHKKAEEQNTKLTQLDSKMARQTAIIAEQQKGIELLTAQLKEQAAQIQKVTAQLEVSRPAARLVSHEE